jgi:transcriptional regulator with XRE-family HTH domain
MNRDPVLEAVGPRLRAVRQQRGTTLAELSAVTGISVSTLSRLESGGRKPTLELLLALARAYQVPLDELTGVPPPGEPDADPKSHEGYEWMYVLSGRLRLRLGEHDLVLRPGEAAEFDTRTPHWFGSPGPEPAEVLMLFGPQGERMHLRARSRSGH